jgi:hypothetical protein
MNHELLLADPSPCLRIMILQELLGKPSSDPEVKELAGLRLRDELYTGLVSFQEKDGSWSSLGKPVRGDKIPATSLALSRLGFLGFGTENPRVKKAADFLFSRQRRDGSWPVSDDYDEGADEVTMIPLQAAFPLAGLARAGFAADPRTEKGYQWLVSKRLEDGAWPTGMRYGVYRGVAGYRRLAHSRWGCRTNTTAALICLAHHPIRRHSPEARRALDHLLTRETRDAASLGFDTARLLGFEEARGALTYYTAFDPALILDLCARVGADAQNDGRVADLARFVRGLAGPAGIWEYAANLAASRWVSFDIARSLAAVESGARRGRGKKRTGPSWQSEEPRTPFTPYPRKKRRY